MHVYAMQDRDGNIKIGKSMRPIDRLASLQTGNANKLTLLAACSVSNPGDVEKHFHDCLKDLGMGMTGEWFKPSLVLTMIVNSMMCDNLQDAAQIAMDYCCFYSSRSIELAKRHPGTIERFNGLKILSPA